MGILHYEGFDYLPTQNAYDGTELEGYGWIRGNLGGVGGGSITTRYGVGKSLGMFNAGNTQLLGSLLRVSQNNLYIPLNPQSPSSTYQDIIVGFRNYFTNIGLPGSDNNDIIRLMGTSGPNNFAVANAIAVLAIPHSGAALPFVSSGNSSTKLVEETHLLEALNHNYWELHVKTNGTTRIRLRRNGVQIADVSGVTFSGSLMQYLVLCPRGASSGGSITSFFDDVYIVDNSDNTGFLGNVRVVDLPPVADTAQKDFTPSTGTDNYAMVDETVQDGDTNYIQSAVPGAKDIYDVANLSGFTPASILGVKLNACAKNLAAPADIRFFLKYGGIEYPASGSKQAVNANYAGRQSPIYSVNPGTGLPWTLADINAIQMGICNDT